jgi:hypothetical protein
VRARLAAYAAYQLRDFFAGRALLIVAVTAAVTWGYAASHGLTLAVFDAAGGLAVREQLARAFEFVVVTFAFAAAAVAAQGLVARHRSRGYDRVLFSRRLNPARYYLQGFVLAGAGSVVMATAASQAYAAAVHPVSVAGVAALVALAWLAVGGGAFLLSTLTPFHVPLLAALVGADLALDRFASGVSTSAFVGTVVVGVRYVLPPAHVVARLREPFVRGLAFDPRAVAWPIGFGMLCLVLAVVLLRRRPGS